MQPSDIEAFREVERTILNKIALNNENARKYELAYLGYRHSIEVATSAYTDTGVAVVDSYLAAAFKHIETKPKGYFQRLAKSTGRPFVYIQEQYSIRRLLQITKSARSENLAAAFLLNAVDYPTEKAATSYEATKTPISKCDGEGYWKFYLHGAEGKELVNMFMESCKTNPVNRIILKLPPR